MRAEGSELGSGGAGLGSGGARLRAEGTGLGAEGVGLGFEGAGLGSGGAQLGLRVQGWGLRVQNGSPVDPSAEQRLLPAPSLCPSSSPHAHSLRTQSASSPLTPGKPMGCSAVLLAAESALIDKPSPYIGDPQKPLRPP